MDGGSPAWAYDFIPFPIFIILREYAFLQHLLWFLTEVLHSFLSLPSLPSLTECKKLLLKLQTSQMTVSSDWKREKEKPGSYLQIRGRVGRQREKTRGQEWHVAAPMGAEREPVWPDLPRRQTNRRASQKPLSWPALCSFWWKNSRACILEEKKKWESFSPIPAGSGLQTAERWAYSPREGWTFQCAFKSNAAASRT